MPVGLFFIEPFARSLTGADKSGPTRYFLAVSSNSSAPRRTSLSGGRFSRYAILIADGTPSCFLYSFTGKSHSRGLRSTSRSLTVTIGKKDNGE